MSNLDVVLCRVPAVIERDALLSFLASRGIAARSVDRSVLVRLTGESNLSWVGYSALDEGYPIFVTKEQEDEARKLMIEFRRNIDVRKVDEPEEDDPSVVDAAGRLFFVCSFWSLALPLAGNLAAYYWFMQSKNVFRLKPKACVFWLLWNVAGIFIGGIVVKTWLANHGWL